MGRTAFVWRYGVCGWGIATAVLWSLTMAYQTGLASLFFLLPIALICFTAGGYVFGWVLWMALEHMHRHQEEAVKT